MQFNIMKLAVLLTASGFAFAAPAAEAGGDVVWINDITSYTIDAGFKCTWFNFANCGGDAISTTGPANVNLMGTNFNKNLESYSCQLYAIRAYKECCLSVCVLIEEVFGT
ncbi:hypothetical protein B0H13DRAFT_2016404 [Mycena leptocephala]|nr:hypothetical protein B0H13DRAFT_2016404 [Mycena leptocephala]